MPHLPQWQRDLNALLARSPYIGYGGLIRLADDLGIKYQTLRSWKNGKRQPDAENRVKLAEARAASTGGSPA